MPAASLPGYDFVFEPDPGKPFRVLSAKRELRLYRLDGQRWLFVRAVPPGVAARWYAHRLTGKAARGFLSLPLVSEV